jgi:hypothetical protein
MDTEQNYGARCRNLTTCVDLRPSEVKNSVVLDRWRLIKNGRAGEIRTHDLLHPMQARYQATLQPELVKGQKDSRHLARQVLFSRADSLTTDGRGYTRIRRRS